MLLNYFKLALRNIWNHKGSTVLNISGMALGFVISLFIVLWVQDETSYDTFHQDSDRIYQIMSNMGSSGANIQTWQGSPEPWAALFESDIPEIEQVLVCNPWDLVLSKNKQTFKERGSFVSPNFFDMLNFELIDGQIATALEDPNSIIISEELAKKYFGVNWQAEGRTIGQTIKVNNKIELKVSGIFANMPENSSFQYNYLVPMAFLFKQFPDWKDQWGNYTYRMYVRLSPAADPIATADKMWKSVKENSKGGSPEHGILLHSLEDLHLYNNFENGKVAGGRIDYVYLFFFAALFVLLMAIINYMNLSTARSSLRAKEVGIRKTIGANKWSLVKQFMCESILVAFLAGFLALMIGQLFIGPFNLLVGKTIEIQFFSTAFILPFFGLILFIGILSGIYPSLMLSSFRIINVLKGRINTRLSGTNFRKGLVVLQFVLSIMLIVSAFIVREQISYIKNKNLGLNKYNVISYSPGWEYGEKLPLIKDGLMQSPQVESISAVNGNPLNIMASTGDPIWEGFEEGQNAIFNILTTDHQFLDNMEVSLIAGQPFVEGMPTDTVNFNYIINEAAAKVMNLEDPVNKSLEFWGRKGKIIGVVKDFHFHSLHSPIDPLILRYEPEETYSLLVRAKAGSTEKLLAQLEKQHKTIFPDVPFEYEFLDTTYEKLYENEQMTSRLSDIFALIALIISCLGLLGLSAFTAERRTKEIGIRKVLGASISNILLMLNKEFGKLIFLAFLLSVPLVIYLMNSWLDKFNYRITLSWKVFAFAGLLIFTIAVLTISVQSIRAATADPVDSLRNE